MASLIKRGKIFYAQYLVESKVKRFSLDTDSLQLAKDKLRTLESALYRGNDNPLPTKTPIGTVLTKFIEYMSARNTVKSVKKDIATLRNAFGPICPELELKNPKISTKRKKDSPKQPRVYLETIYFEQLTTAAISEFITNMVKREGLSPKTANNYRELLTRMYNWAMETHGLRLPNDKNPVSKVERYKEHVPEISFLKRQQIDEQLNKLKPWPMLQTIVAVFIYAGLRREELCWLTLDDIDLSAGGNGMIHIRAKTVNGVFWEPKTKVNRVVPISNALKAYLDRYRPSSENGIWYFPSPLGCWWDPDNLSADLRDANHALKLDWTCLDFRHTFGSHLAMKGESLYKISKLMGNSPDICKKHYAALLPESLITAVEFDAPQIVPDPPPPQPMAEVIPFERPRLRLVVNNR